MNGICADCGKDIPKMTVCWLIHLTKQPGVKIGLTKTICVDCHEDPQGTVALPRYGDSL